MSTVQCPVCRESIQAAALKCRFCGHVLVPDLWRAEYGDWSRDPARYGATRLPQFSAEQRSLFESVRQVLQEEEHSKATRPTSPVAHVVRAPAKGKTHPVAWGCLVLLIFSFFGLVLSDAAPKARPAAAERPSAAAERASTPAPRPDTGRAADSVYEQDITRATTSRNLSNSDIAWHALNTYGWDCEQVVSRGPDKGGYFTVTCSSGKRLRVYPRSSQHPRVTNETGGYD